MCRFLLIITFYISGTVVIHSQKASPVSWVFELIKTDADHYEIQAIANIKKDWILYSQFTDDNGPVPTSFYIGEEAVRFEEKTKAIREYDELFEVEVIKFKNEAVFTKKIQKKDKPNIQGYVTFMTCDGTKCLPPADVNFNLKF